MKCWMIGAIVAIAAISGVSALRLAAQERSRDVEIRSPDTEIIPRADRESLDKLDYSFQQRFQTIDGINFGLSRIPTTPEHNEFRTVRAQTPEEKQAVAHLTAQNRGALFMVAGLRAVTFQLRSTATTAAVPQAQQGPRPQIESSQPAAVLESPFDRVITRPVWLSGMPGSQTPPTQAELLAGVKESFAAFAKHDSHAFTAGEWRVLARPVRIGKSGCLKCHQQGPSGEKLHHGDVVGAALYLLASAPTPAASAP